MFDDDYDLNYELYGKLKKWTNRKTINDASVTTFLQLSNFDNHHEASVNIKKECMILSLTKLYKEIINYV